MEAFGRLGVVGSCFVTLCHLFVTLCHPLSPFVTLGKYPNRNYPRIFDDEHVGGEARKVFDDGQALLKRIVEEKLIQGKVRHA